MKMIRVEPGYEMQLSKEISEGLKSMAGNVILLDKISDGFIIRVCSYSWDDIFAEKLPMSKKQVALDLSEISGDEFLF
jgi:hypothetical protein